MQRGKSICCYSKFFDGVILENPTYDRVIFYYASAKEVETLYIKEIYHHKNELSTPLVPSKSKEDATNETLQVVGILGKTRDNEVQEMSYK